MRYNGGTSFVAAASSANSQTSITRLLREKQWFGGLLPETITYIVAKALTRNLSHDELWMPRTERATGIALIMKGGLRSTTFTQEGKEYVFSIMRAGDIWGLVSTIDGLHNANDVYAHGETTLLTIERQVTLETMKRCPDFREYLTRILCERLRMANAVLEDRALKPIEARLARLLLSLRGNSDPAPRPTRIEVTQEMLANILSCTRPTVSIKLKTLERDGLIAVTYGCIELLDLDRIEKLSGDSDYFYF
jgi:CRP/FNR family cyclic AMP-dependent transcriptional regulator